MVAKEDPLLQRVGRLAARAGALTLSIGVVGFLMVRAGGLGCSASEDARPEQPPSASGGATSETPSTSAAPSASGAKPEFMGGSKAWADPNLADKVLPSSEPSVTAAPAPDPPKNANPAPPKPKPTFFPGTKSGDFHIDRANPPLDSQQKK